MNMTHMHFDAVSEDKAGPKWAARWNRSWFEYRAWFLSRGGLRGPSRELCEQAMVDHMPELMPTYRRLCTLAGNDDLAARFLSTWSPPAYLGGCSIAAMSHGGVTRLVRNYDLSPDLNEGLLMRTHWGKTPVMGMIEFLWGLSDGVNGHGLSIALAFGGRTDVAHGFGITTILRYIMETCANVGEALDVLRRVPSHMAYNVTMADQQGETCSVEVQPGGGYRLMDDAIATNHQHGDEPPTRPGFTKTFERHNRLKQIFDDRIAPDDLSAEFLVAPLYQDNFAGGMGTLFTAEYDPARGTMLLRWKNDEWYQTLDAFVEGHRDIQFATVTANAYSEMSDVISGLASGVEPHLPLPAAALFSQWLAQASGGQIDWIAFGRLFSQPGDWGRPETCHD